jgi:hypothetical protein
MKYHATAASIALVMLFAAISLYAPCAHAQSIPVAYVYVSSGKNQIYQYYAALDGRLTSVGSVSAITAFMALNDHWLFANNPKEIIIQTFSIDAVGMLHYVSMVDAQQQNNPSNCGGPHSLFLDHTGATLYAGDLYANQCSDNGYQSWQIDPNTGDLSFTGLNAPFSPQFGDSMSFMHNNVYAYGSNCYYSNAQIFGYKRNADGTLVNLNISPAIPAYQGGSYCAFRAAADSNNNVAVSLTPVSGGAPIGPPQIAVYSADASGTLTTNSTQANMPLSAVTHVNDMSMAPSGRLLAVAGSTGLEVLFWNGSNQATRFTPLLTHDNIRQIFWDNANHLYALSSSLGKLHVFTVTPTSYNEAPGSPYLVNYPINLAVMPKTGLSIN